MSRKRYLSTNISVDPRVRDLAANSGEFAALLYTWMIPHADDEGGITSNADELLLQVVPGFRWRTADDVDAAVAAMEALGLVERVAGERLRFPSKPFYKYQAYIGPGRRVARTEPEPEPPSNGTGDKRDSAQLGANPRKAPSRAGESSVSSSSSSSVSSATPTATHSSAPRRLKVVGEPTPKPTPAETPVGMLIDKIRAIDPAVEIYGDRGFAGSKLKQNPETDLGLVAEAYVSFRHGEWPGSNMLRQTGALAWVIGDLGGYVQWRSGQSKAKADPRRAEMARTFAHLGDTA